MSSEAKTGGTGAQGAKRPERSARAPAVQSGGFDGASKGVRFGTDAWRAPARLSGSGGSEATGALERRERRGAAAQGAKRLEPATRSDRSGLRGRLRCRVGARRGRGGADGGGLIQTFTPYWNTWRATGPIDQRGLIQTFTPYWNTWGAGMDPVVERSGRMTGWTCRSICKCRARFSRRQPASLRSKLQCLVDRGPVHS